MKTRKTVFDNRLEQHYNELKWLYCELYRDEGAFDYFVQMLRRCWADRKKALRNQDARREAEWYGIGVLLNLPRYNLLRIKLNVRNLVHFFLRVHSLKPVWKSLS